MEHQRHGMLSIGGFADASSLSIKALRLYEQLGILEPDYVDRDSGYRYYREEQLETARRVRMMRQMEMPLATVRQVLAAAPEQAGALVLQYWQSREQRMEQARRLVDELLSHLREEHTSMAFDVQVKEMNAQPIVGIKRRVKVDGLEHHIGASLERLYALLPQQNATPSGSPFGIYHGPIDHEEDGPIEVCVPVQTDTQSSGEVVGRRVSGGRFACVTLRGQQCAFPEVLKGYDAVYDWVRRHGYTAPEPPREIWHTIGGTDEVLEVALLFREGRRSRR